MAQVEITDWESFKAWLKTRPAADDDILAARIGLRVFPLWGGQLERPWAIQKKLTALPILRILLIKSIALGDKEKYQRQTARGAAIAAADLRTRVYRYDYAAFVADAEAAARAATIADLKNFWAAVSFDVNALQNGQDAFHLPLWPDALTYRSTIAIRKMKAIWAKDPDTWAFWVWWWDGVIAGKPLPFDLQRDVALIEDAV